MPTESTISYETLLDEWKAERILSALQWCWAHLGYAVPIVLIWFFIKNPDVFRGILNWIKGLSENRKRKKRLERQISTCSAPRLTGVQRKKRMPKAVMKLSKGLEDAQPDERFRYCVVCPNEDLLQCYAVQFYERMEQIAVVDHYGWIYYDSPDDKELPLNIQSCLFEDLKICLEEKMPQDRFREFVKFFDDRKKHTLLVIRMCEFTEDRKLAQIANLKGLSIILFSTVPVGGFDSIVIPVKGGK